MKLLEFALLQLWRRRYKNGAILLILALLVAVVAGLFLSAGSIRMMLERTLDDLPDIYIQRVVAGRLAPMREDRIEPLYAMSGIEAVYPRVWGYYYYQPAGVNFTVVGVDPDYPAFSKAITELLETKELPPQSMIVGEGVAQVLRDHWYKDRFNFVRPDGELVEVAIAGVFTTDNLLNYDTILMPLDLARRIFMMEPDLITDVAIDLSNPAEMDTIAKKLAYTFADSRIITKADLRASYQNMFDYKSGVFLAFMLVAFFGFFILVFEKATSVSKEQSREIAILKAVGWRVGDILKMKFLESFLIVIFGYAIGILGAYWWVFGLQGPLLRSIFAGFSVLKPPFVLEPYWDTALLISIFLITAPIYLAATIVPNWQAAVSDVEEALR